MAHDPERLGLWDVEEPPPARVGGVPDELWDAYIRARTGYVLHHSAPRSLQEAAWMRLSEGAAQRIGNCGKIWREHRDPDGRYRWILYRCRSRWCPYCGSIWQRKVVGRLRERGLPEGTVSVLATVTTGRRVWGPDLRETVAQTVKIWRRWRTWAKDYGVHGGIYSIEIVPPALDEAEGFHVHLHATLVVDRSATWLQADEAYMRQHRPGEGKTTPALVWFARSWAGILRDYWPARYAELPKATSLLPSVSRDWAGITVSCPERLAVADLGGRWPKRRRIPESLLDRKLKDNLYQSIKYTAKPLDESEQASRSAWEWILIAMAGRRRAQTWGVWHGIRLSDPERDEEERSEATGTVLSWTKPDPDDISSISRTIGAFMYGWKAGVVRWKESKGRPYWIIIAAPGRDPPLDGG